MIGSLVDIESRTEILLPAGNTRSDRRVLAYARLHTRAHKGTHAPTRTASHNTVCYCKGYHTTTRPHYHSFDQGLRWASFHNAKTTK